LTPRQLIEPARHAGAAVLRTQSDERLVDLVRDGNDRAFEAIVHRYRRPLLRYCGRILSPARAEDAVQQAFVNAYRAMTSDAAELRLRPWLYRIAHNSALNTLRQSGPEYEPVSEEIDGVETPPQAFERGERLRTVVASVKDLPSRQRDAVVLRALEGRSYEEIAAELGVTGGAVRQLLNRARNTLRNGATALTPSALAARLGGSFDTSERVAQIAAGAGGGAALAKGVAVLAAAGAVIAGTGTAVLKDGGPVSGDEPATAAIPTHTARASDDNGGAAPKHLRVPGPGTAAHRRAHEPSAAPAHPNSSRPSSNSRSGNGRHDAGGRVDDHSGDRSGSSDDGRRSGSTTTTDDHSGPSSTDDGHSGSSNSGPGSGSDDPMLMTSPETSGRDGGSSGSDSSGPGSGSTTSGSSGSGSSGSMTTDDSTSGHH
jgi:RNA polymerase sigma factor (sigma-70 family)